MNPLRAIRQKCIECSGGSRKEVRLCSVSACPLHVLRLGKNPGRRPSKRTEKQLQALRQANGLRSLAKALQTIPTVNEPGHDDA